MSVMYEKSAFGTGNQFVAIRYPRGGSTAPGSIRFVPVLKSWGWFAAGHAPGGDAVLLIARLLSLKPRMESNSIVDGGSNDVQA